ncbi:MAG: hypothetical protein QM648_05370 [Solirubrobacterales bacterium]
MISSNRAIRTPLLALAATAMLLAASAVWSGAARAATCGSPVAYPGDSASSAQYANWMANGALALKIPAELPVMAGLVESGMRNLNYGDADSVGFFQMRTSIWDTGEYKGYLKKPDLQLKWFTDQATAVRASYIKNGKADPALTTATYGVWIADIERPAAQYRGRYQLRLGDAENLIADTCPGLVGVNVLAPTSSLKIKSRQHPARTGAIAVRVSCPKATCVATGTAQFRLPGRRGVVKVGSDTAMIAAGGHATVKLRVGASLRKSIRKRLAGGATTRARLRISVAGTSGAATVRVRKIVLAR